MSHIEMSSDTKRSVAEGIIQGLCLLDLSFLDGRGFITKVFPISWQINEEP